MSLIMKLPSLDTPEGEALAVVLRKVMLHAVAGHSDAFTHTYCNDAEHALDILMDDGVVLFDLDEDPEDMIDS